MKNFSSFLKRARSVLPLILFGVGLLLLFAWMEARPDPRRQWNFNAALSTPTPVRSLDGPGWWNNVKTPTSKKP